MKKLFIIFLLFSNLINSQQLAFPTANGAGAYVTGGRGFAVYKVTNLNNSGSGSLRQAVADANSAGGGTIVFDVSGIININSTMGFCDNCTIAGQTAPSGGITIDGQRVFLSNVDNLIVRYIRFRGGVDGGDDSVTVRQDVTNQIWDHCSFGYGDDEGASWYEGNGGFNVDNITIQRSLFGENSKGSIIGGGSNTSTTTGDLSFNYNLFYNNSHRFPNTSGDNANIEVINNVVWNVNTRLVRVNGDGQNLNHIGNYYHFNNRGINDDRVNMYSYQTGYPNIYTSGNIIVAPTLSSPLSSTISQMNADNTLSWKHFIDGTSTPQGTRNKGDQLESEYFTNTQHSLLGNNVTILNANTAFNNVKSDVGANKLLNGDGTISLYMDDEDTNYLNQINLGNYNTPLPTSSYNVISYTGSSRSGSYDTDNDGMPDTWENSTFGNLTRNGTGDFDSDGYTDLEEFLNLVDGSVVNIPQITRTDSNPTSIVQGGTYIPPTGTWTDVEDGSGSATVGGDTVDVNTVGTYNVTLSHTDTDGNTGSLTIPYIITSSVINVTDVDVSPKTATVTIGQSTVISVTITPNNATNQNGVWSSSNNSVATIDQSGRVTGLSEGNTTIAFTSSDGDFSDTSVITVIAQSQNTGGISKKQKIKLINN